jgi:hypothetical protein
MAESVESGLVAQPNAAKRMHRPRSGRARCLDSMVEEMDAVTELLTDWRT